MPPDQMNQAQVALDHTLDVGLGGVDGLDIYETAAATEDPVNALPPGVHPMDPSGGGDARAAKPDTYGSKANGTGKPAFGTPTDKALGVFQRSAHDWTANRWVLSNNTNAVEVAGRSKGRTRIVLSCPTSANDTLSLGVVVGPTEGEVQNGIGGWPIYPGESLTLDTEAPVWVGLLGANATGVVRVAAMINPPGGSGGGQ